MEEHSGTLTTLTAKTVDLVVSSQDYILLFRIFCLNGLELKLSVFFIFENCLDYRTTWQLMVNYFYAGFVDVKQGRNCLAIALEHEGEELNRGRDKAEIVILGA
ncbi:unnamed protein product [Vicia faba]|uniref:Uncharacterized protein n=1 Tax=Vicia faba TaxID=3906 RepID=A0AAV0YWQ0_VICFA|nr:unnamed protein product [Vicia faba]